MKSEKSVSLKNYTTIRIGGKSSYIYFPESIDDLLSLRKIIALKKTIILGKGSNIAFKDNGYKHNILSLKYFTKPIKLINKDSIITIGSTSCARFSKYCNKNRIPGFEFIHGIPGSIGGALAMNAGAFGDEIWNHVISVDCILNNGQIKSFERDDIRTSYRYVENGDIKIFLNVSFKVNTKMKYDKNLLSKYSKNRSASQPIRQWSSGCIFKNPSKNVSASTLIDSAGLEKEKIGGIYISRKHCNYLINDGSGTCEDLEELIKYIHDKIKHKYDILLDKEICIY